MGIKDEFTRSNFLMEYETPQDFYLPRCRCMNALVLVAMRALFTVYTISILLIDIAYNVHSTNSVNWLKYLTNWNYVMIVLYFTSAFVITGSEVLSLRKQRKLGMLSSFVADSDYTVNDINDIEKPGPNERSIVGGKLQDEYASYTSFSRRRRLRRLQHVTPRGVTCGFKLIWVLHNIVLTMTTAIVASYWSIIYDYNRELPDLKFFLTIDKHGINLLLLLVDLFLNRIPFRILHFIHPLLLACTYVVFHIIYWASTGDNIYSAADWENSPGYTVLGLVGFFLVIFTFHFLLYLLHCTVIQNDCKTKIGFFMLLLALLFVTLAILTFCI